MTLKTHFSGWDIGGAHLKVTRCDLKGQVLQLIEISCPLWQGIDKLEQAIQSAIAQLNNDADSHAVTLTGELADIFPDRQTGVTQILDTLQNALPADDLQVFSINGFIGLSSAKKSWQTVASMNWLATARWLAQIQPEGILLDIGSTTTDIIVIKDNQPHVRAYDDFGRLTTGELLYTGVVRTPLMAISSQAPFLGRYHQTTAELFATTADCWLLLKQLTHHDLHDRSADGQSWQLKNCQRRLARMIGTDQNMATDEQWRQLAYWYAEQQTQHIMKATLQVLSSQPLFNESAPILGAGIGRFIAQQIAQRLNHPYIDFSDHLQGHYAHSASYAPATALALLARHELIK